MSEIDSDTLNQIRNLKKSCHEIKRYNKQLLNDVQKIEPNDVKEKNEEVTWKDISLREAESIYGSGTLTSGDDVPIGDSLAMNTYYKELSSISKAKQNSGDDDDKNLNILANTLKSTSRQRYNDRKKRVVKRRGSGDGGGYVNVKNQQFNEKLARERRLNR